MITTNGEIAEIMSAVEPEVKRLLGQHQESQKLWMPSSLILEHPSLADMDIHEISMELRGRSESIPREIRAVFALNLLTEEGLPAFHRLLAVHLGDDSYWREWINLWTAEEDRHGAVLHDYMVYVGMFNAEKIEWLQYHYLCAGFHPDWGYNPLTLLAYTTMQELATHVSHGKTMSKIKPYDPHCAFIVGHVTAEELRHHLFYRPVFEKMITLAPSLALPALWKAIETFEMPGKSVPGFADFAYIAQQLNIFTASDLAKIIRDLSEHWSLGSITALSHEAEESRNKILARPSILDRANRGMCSQEKKEVLLPLWDKPLVV